MPNGRTPPPSMSSSSGMQSSPHAMQAISSYASWFFVYLFVYLLVLRILVRIVSSYMS